MSDMTDPQEALIDAVDAALTGHAEMHGSWVLTYEEQRLDDQGEVLTAISSVADGSPAAQLGLLTTTQHRLRADLSEREDQ